MRSWGRQVALENALLHEGSLRGTIKVANLCFKKGTSIP